jgi:hypothetical protein
MVVGPALAPAQILRLFYRTPLARTPLSTEELPVKTVSDDRSVVYDGVAEEKDGDEASGFRLAIFVMGA